MEFDSSQPVVSYQPSRNNDVENQTPTKEKTFSDSPDVKPIERETTDTSAIQELGQKRRYYSRLWHRTWNVAVHEGVWPRVAYSAVGIIIGVVWIAIVIILANSQLNAERKVEGQFRQASKDSNDDTGGVSLQGAIKQFDQNSKILTVSWSGVYQGDKNSTITNLVYAFGASGLQPWSLDIYRDIDTTVYNVPDGQGGTVPVWVVDNKTAPHIATIGAHEWDNFDTDIEFGGTDATQSIFKQPLFGYPLDVMVGNIVFVASWTAADVKAMFWTDENDKPIANPDNITTVVVPLSTASISNNPPNWRFDIGSGVTSNCTDFGNWTEILGFDVTDPKNNERNSMYVLPCHLKIDITAVRPPIVIFAVAMAVIVNWTSTLFIFVLTCEVLIMRRGWMLSGTDLLAVNFTALFALPTVRLLLPGAPDFGVLIDLVGIVPNVIVISICITAIAITKLNRTKPKDDDEKHKSD